MAAPQQTNDLEIRVANLEHTVQLLLAEIADLNMRLDLPPAQAKGQTQAKPSKKPPSDIITPLLKQRPMNRAEMMKVIDLDEQAINKCLNWMYKNRIARKHETEKALVQLRTENQAEFLHLEAEFHKAEIPRSTWHTTALCYRHTCLSEPGARCRKRS